MAGEALAAVSVKRLSSFQGSARAWKVVIDGEEAAVLRAGDCCVFRVYPGEHVLEVRPGRPAVAASRAFSVAVGELAEFECRRTQGRLRSAVLLQARPSSRVVGARPRET